MEDLRDDGNGSLTDGEIDPSGDPSSREGKESSRAKSAKAPSGDASEDRKKKQNALKGREAKENRESSESEDGGRHTAHKAGGENTSSQSRQSLQSGQTTVQFSSGGNANMAGSLSSLLGLFASSAVLARAEGGGILSNAGQSNALSLRATLQAANNQPGSLLNEEGKKLKGITEIAQETAFESGAKKLNFDIGLNQGGHSGAGTGDIFGALLKNISAAATENTKLIETPTTAPYFSFGFPFAYVQTFNANAFFFSPEVIFAFPNSAVTGSILLSNGGTSTLSPFSSIISTYLSTAGLATSSTYGYEILSPLPTSDIPGWKLDVPLTSGVTIVPTNTVLSVTLENLPTSLTNATTGLSLTPRGDLFVNVTSPMSVLLDVKIPGSSIVFPIRIDAGPGSVVTTANGNATLLPNTMVGVTDANGNLESAVFRDSAGRTIVGNGEGLLVNASGGVTLTGAGTTPTAFNLPSSGVYAFPSNTIYRHVGTSDSNVPQAATYGNFANYNGNGSPPVPNVIELPQAPNSYTLTMGGNVLDVYGAKYGVADTLTVVLPTSTGTSSTANIQANTLTMGGNTLAGFGLSYGDFQSLILNAIPSGSPSALTEVPNSSALVAPTNLIFRGNALYVDKPVASILYPGVQTLDIEVRTAPGQLTQVDNINIVLNNSILQGNTDKNIFYSGVPNIGDLGISTRYNGFITGVTVSTVVLADGDKHVAITTAPLTLVTNADGSQVITGNNSLTFGNDIYIGGVKDPQNPQFTPQNIYNFTLVGDTQNQPVMEGNPLITNFTPLTDSLNLQITPALFRTLDLNHNKQPISNSELDQAVTKGYIQINPLTLQGLPASEARYLTATTPTGTAITGTTLTFEGGGSLNLVGLDLTGSSTPFETLNTTVTVGLTYAPVSPIIPGPSQVFVYGENTTPYFTELDNFFNNSLYATYVVSNSASLPAEVTVDPYGTLTVANSTIPFLGPLAITATDENHNTATNTALFGFLDVPVTNILAGSTGAGPSSSMPNALVGGVGSTLIGNPASAYALSAIGTAPTPLTQTFTSNLLVDTAGNATGYGTFQNLAFTVEGNATAYVPGAIQGNAYTFNPNALAISGTAYGVSGSLAIQAEGATGASFNLLGGNGSGSFDNNNFYFGYLGNQPLTETLYGNGSLFGDFNSITITIAGQNLISTPLKVNSPTSVDLSAHVEGNTFYFSPTSLHVYGDQASQTTSLYANVGSLMVTAQDAVSRAIPNLTVTSTATFINNGFVFGNANLSGGLGTTDFYGHLSTFGDVYNFNAPLIYNGFVGGVNVSVTNGVMTITSNDGANNYITWGNATYTGGTGSSSKNTYNFTLVEDTTGHAVMQGFDAITNFNPATDTLVFNIQANLFARLGMLNANVPDLASKLDQDLAVSSVGSLTTLSFEGGGSLALDGSSLGISNLAQLAASFPNSVRINSLGATYAPPTINAQAVAQFDPVFINIVQPLVFGSFLSNTNVNALTYTATGLPSGGISLSTGGALTVNVSGPVDVFVTPTFFDGQTHVTLPQPLHLFAINATDQVIHRDGMGGNITDSQAFETATPGNTVIGGGADILSNSSSALINTPILTYGSKLIYDVSAGAGGHVAIGDVQSIQFINNGSASDINNQAIIFNPNLFNVNAAAGGGVWGNVQTVTLSADATLNAGVPVSASVTHNHFTSGANTLYGSGTLYGNIQTISLISSVQTAGGIDSATVLNSGNPITLTVSSAVNDNAFTFAPTSLTVEGDEATSTNTLYANVGSLALNKQATYPVSLPFNVSLALSVSFSGNTFDFGNTTLTGGSGTNIFYGHLHTFGDPYNFTPSGYTYDGFVNGVDVSTSGNGQMVITTTDGNNNQITWGNATYTGGAGPNAYNFTIIKDGSGREVMQGFDVITNFNPAKDKLVFNLKANIFSQQLSGVTVSNDGANTTLSFAGGGSITLDGIVTDLNSLASTNSIQINQLGVSYTPIALNPTTLPSFTYFNPVVIGVNKPQAFADVLANPYNPLALTYSLTTSQSSVPLNYNLTTTGFLSGVTLSPEGTLVVNSPVPTYGTATVTITDPTNHSVSFTTPIFALNATDGVIHTGTGTASLLTGNITDSQVFQTNADKDATNTFNNTIIGGGGNTTTALGEPELVFDPIAHPTTGTPIVYGSKLIYDISIGGGRLGIGGHTAIGDVKDVQFVNNGMASGASSPGVNGQTIIFNPNLFNINGAIFGNTETITMAAAGLATAVPTGAAQANIENNVITAGSNTILGGGTVFGNAQATTLSAAGGVNASGPIDAHIQGNTFTFGSNTVFLDNNIIALDDFQGYTGTVPSTVYGNMQSLTLAVNDPATATGGTVGNGYVTGNTFTFGGNTLGGGLISSTAYASLGALIMENKETSGFTHAGASQIANNTITFGDTTIISRAVIQPMSFYGDIADLSQTDFITQPLTAQTVNGHVSVTDAENNAITWGNDTFIQSTNAADTFTFTLLSPVGYNLGTTTSPIGAIMQGNVTIKNFDPGLGVLAVDQFVFNLSPLLFKTITAQYGDQTNYNRTITGPQLFQALSLPLGNGGNAVLQFTYGSITIPDYKIQTPDRQIHANLAYAPAPISIINTNNANPVSLVLSGAGGFQNNGVYGNVLDQYFNNIDIGNQGSTYTVTPIFANLPSAVSSPFALPSGLSFDQYGTATASSSSPSLTLVTVTPTDVHFSSNIQSLPLAVAAFSGNIASDPGTGTFVGNPTGSASITSSLLQGQSGNEIMIGSMQNIIVDLSTTTLPQQGGNVILNTNPGNTAYGDAQTIVFNVESPASAAITGHSYNFGANYFDVVGTVFGTADTLAINVLNGATNQVLMDSVINAFSSNTLTFGASTIYGQGTIYGNLKALQINAVGGQNDTADPDALSPVSAAAQVNGNTFSFAGTNIAILGDGANIIYPNLGSLSFAATPGVSSANLDASATITNNHFIFGDNIVIGGNGPTNYYPGIDLTLTDFWNSEVLYAPTFGSLTVQDGSANTITWGNNTLNLGTGQDIIHANLLDATISDGTGLPLLDQFGMPILDGTGLPLLDQFGMPILDGTGLPILDGTGLPLLDEFGMPILDEFGMPVLDGTGLPILDEFGMPVLDGTGLPILDGTGLPILDGTGLPMAGFGVPIMEGNLTIYNFNPTLDVIRFNLSTPLYNSLSYSLTPTSLNAFQTTTLITNIPSIKVSISGGNTLIQFLDPAGGGNFGTITLEGLTGTYSSLAGFLAAYPTALQVGTTFVGTGGPDTFTFRVPSDTNNAFSSFQEYNVVTQFNPAQDTVDVILPVALYNSLSAYAMLNEKTVDNILSASAETPTGGITLSADAAGTGTSLNFVTNGTVTGSIDLEGVSINSLSGFGTHFQLRIEGTSPISNTFTFGVPTNAANDFSSFTDYAYITNFNPAPTHDILQLTLPLRLYNTVNPYGMLTSAALETAVATAASGITTGVDSAGTGTSINFVTNGITTGAIDLQGVSITNLADLGPALEIGIRGTSSSDAFYFWVSDNTTHDFSSFTDKTYISNFNPAQDQLNLTISNTLYNELAQSYDLSTPTAVEAALTSSAATAIGGITTGANAAGTGTELNFTTGGMPSGSIDLQDISLANLQGLGSGLQVGLYGTGANNTFTFTMPVGATNDFTSFQNATYITNFNPAQDTLHVTVPGALYNDLSGYALLNDTTIDNILNTTASTPTGGITVTQTPAQFSSANGVTVDSKLNFTTNGVTAGSIDLHNVNISSVASLGTHFDLGIQGTSGSDTFIFYVPSNASNNFSSFTGRPYIADFGSSFGSSPDHIQIIMPVALYNAVSQNGTYYANPSVSSPLVNALAASAGTQTGGITVTSNGASGTNINFVTNGVTSGFIDLQNLPMDQFYQYNSIGFGYTEQGTAGTNATTGKIFNFMDSSMQGGVSYFNQFDHITHFNLGVDTLQITVPLDDYNNFVRGYETTSGTSLQASSQQQAALQQSLQFNNPFGHIGISEVTTNTGTSTVLHFGFTNFPDSGTITLHNTAIGTNLVDFGDSLQFGYYEKGTTANDTFNFNVTGNDYSSFQQFAHIIDFSTAHDSFEITLSQDLYRALSSDNTLSGTVSISALENGTNGTQINVVEAPAQYSPANGGLAAGGATVDSVVQFLSNNQLSGSVTLHNVAITDLSQLPHLVIAHA